MEAKFKVVSGDGVQGLLKTETNIMLLAHYLRAKIHPHLMRLGLGLGGLTTQLCEDVSLMDGKCFQFAGEALERGKNYDRWVYFTGDKEDFNRIINSSFLFQQLYYDQFNKQQSLLVRNYMVEFIENGNENLSRISALLNIPLPNVSRNLKLIQWEEVFNTILTYPTIYNISNSYHNFDNNN